jgi:ABC-2 type transport system permease protein
MSRWRSIGLVARREVLERGRSRGFILSMLFTTALVIGSILLPAFLFRDSGVTRLGVVEPSPSGLSAALEAASGPFDRELALTAYADAAAADAALTGGQVDAVVIVPADLSSAGVVRFHEESDQATSQLVAAAVTALRVGEVLGAAGVDEAELAAAQAPPTVETIDERTDADMSGFVVANIGAILILISIFGFGTTVLTGVVEEKQSRVVEVVLSTVRARDLLMGKVLGIGILGLLQLAVFAVAGLIALLFTQDIEIPATTPWVAVQIGIWFVLGYALYATAFGFMGALASRIEEASNASTPIVVVALVSYFVGIFAAAEDPSGTVAVIATYVPPSAPFVVPLRVAFDAISPIEIALSIGVTLVGIWLLFVVGARIYAGAVLQNVARMKLRDAWRAAGE